MSTTGGESEMVPLTAVAAASGTDNNPLAGSHGDTGDVESGLRHRQPHGQPAASARVSSQLEPTALPSDAVRLFGPQAGSIYRDTQSLFQKSLKRIASAEQAEPRYDLCIVLSSSKKESTVKAQERLVEKLMSSRLIVKKETSSLDESELLVIGASRENLEVMAKEIRLHVPVAALVFVPCDACAALDCGNDFFQARKMVRMEYEGKDEYVEEMCSLCPSCYGKAAIPEGWVAGQFEEITHGQDRYAHLLHCAFQGTMEDDPSLIPLVEDDSLYFRSAYRLRIIKSMISLRSGRGGLELDLDNLQATNVISKVVPLHDDKWHVAIHAGDGEDACARPVDYLMKHAVMTWKKPPWTIPIGALAQYFGAKVGMYFNWVTFYTRSLVPLSVLGFICFFLTFILNVKAPVDPVFGFITCVWCTLMSIAWTRRRNEMVTEWGMIGFKDREPPRARFVGEMRIVDLEKNTFSLPLSIGPDGREKYYPAWRRAVKKYCITMPLIAAVLFLCVVSMIGVIGLREYLSRNTSLSASNINTITSVISALSIVIFDLIYTTMSQKLNSWENYRTDSEHENSLIIKTFCFQFINNYGALLLLAYLPSINVGRVSITVEHIFALPVGSPPDAIRQKRMDSMWQQLLIIMVIKQVQRNLLSILVPFFKSLFESNKRKIKRTATKRKINPMGEREPQWYEKEAQLPVYEGVFYEYSEMLIQFGYVTMFAVVFPLAPLCALLNNWVEIRLDAHKMMSRTTRPYPRGAEDIGAWKAVVNVMSFLCVLNNCAIVSFVSNDIAKYWSVNTNLGRLAFFVTTDHLLFAMIIAARVGLPAMSFATRATRAKDEVLQADFEKNSKDTRARTPRPPSNPRPETPRSKDL